MLVQFFDETAWHLDNRTHAIAEVGQRDDCQGLPRKEAVCIYVIRPDNRGRPHGLFRMDLTPLEAHNLAQQLELSAKALAGKFTGEGTIR